MLFWLHKMLLINTQKIMLPNPIPEDLRSFSVCLFYPSTAILINDLMQDLAL